MTLICYIFLLLSIHPSLNKQPSDKEVLSRIDQATENKLYIQSRFKLKDGYSYSYIIGTYKNGQKVVPRFIFITRDVKVYPTNLIVVPKDTKVKFCDISLQSGLTPRLKKIAKDNLMLVKCDSGYRNLLGGEVVKCIEQSGKLKLFSELDTKRLYSSICVKDDVCKTPPNSVLKLSSAQAKFPKYKMKCSDRYHFSNGKTETTVVCDLSKGSLTKEDKGKIEQCITTCSKNDERFKKFSNNVTDSDVDSKYFPKCKSDSILVSNKNATVSSDIYFICKNNYTWELSNTTIQPLKCIVKKKCPSLDTTHLLPKTLNTSALASNGVTIDPGYLFENLSIQPVSTGNKIKLNCGIDGKWIVSDGKVEFKTNGIVIKNVKFCKPVTITNGTFSGKLFSINSPGKLSCIKNHVLMKKKVKANNSDFTCKADDSKTTGSWKDNSNDDISLYSCVKKGFCVGLDRTNLLKSEDKNIINSKFNVTLKNGYLFENLNTKLIFSENELTLECVKNKDSEETGLWRITSIKTEVYTNGRVTKNPNFCEKVSISDGLFSGKTFSIGAVGNITCDKDYFLTKNSKNSKNIQFTCTAEKSKKKGIWKDASKANINEYKCKGTKGKDKESKSNTGLIIGLCVGIPVFILVVVIIVLWRRKMCCFKENT